MKVLIIGDVHATVEELADCQALLDLVIITASKSKPDYVVFLGDLHHTHAVVRVEVMDFWKRNLAELGRSGQRTLLLVGNHDRPNNVNLRMDALAYESATTHVISEPETINNIRFVPWQPTNEEFIAACGSASVVFGHQEVKGGHYDNGMYIPNGVDLELVPASALVLGHLHKPAVIGTAWYPGAPRWRTASDVNVDRAIWMVEVNGSHVVCGPDSGPISTRGICRALYHVEDREENLVTPTVNVIQPARLTVNIYGSAEYIASRKSHWESMGASVATFANRQVVRDVKESDGVGVALQKYVGACKPKYGTSPEVLAGMIAERIRI